MLYGEIMAVCSQIHTKHINTLCGQNVELYIKIQSVPRSKHTLRLGYKNQSVNAVYGNNLFFVLIQAPNSGCLTYKTLLTRS